MAQGLSTRFVRTGPMSRVSQAGYVSAMAKLPCPNATQDRIKLACPVHYASNCPKIAG